MSLTDDITFLVKFINESVYFPIPILRSVGVIVMKGEIAFHLQIFPEYIAYPRFKNRLPAEKWIEKQPQNDPQWQLDKLIGPANAKNWCVFKFPETSSLNQYIIQKPRVVATEANINLPFQENTPLPSEAMNKSQFSNLFPLVTIQYERVVANETIFEYDPQKTWKNPKLANCKICHVAFEEIRPPVTK
ncbi:hypothetical protein TVAG_310670 [Trichomonas vaginalis G3]|uniref:Initiator binding domain-containing protein n=1 Tax=Trichomonas vaginalis (strain ATCC PRA-98 / G3) TaxID=412133 RepID=A2G0A0_TRIV3|nr:hypothetical protein TVAGG3_0140720 [Trichomonas vaginalis G3]EAX89415.1 hypothetical protein TVAG_310670 [Trichomonas vaginalis G3]KAI5546566.1 hypothetical protein TVAGG3_0140720 [Trichomonas vaginalis G3]|eukprot:XP_001302345.1 hypothetical protein [Trichomonas vaginalis G3]